LRDLLTEIKSLGYPDCKYLKPQEKTDLKTILTQEVIMYRNKLIVAFVLWIPILIFAWVIPYSTPYFLTENVYVKGDTLYIFLMLIFSSIIQICVGYPFYLGAYKSLKNKSANMDVLVVLGTSAAWIYGVALCFVGHELMSVSISDIATNSSDITMS
jgi:Cu+-exporting ATPase